MYSPVGEFVVASLAHRMVGVCCIYLIRVVGLVHATDTIPFALSLQATEATDVSVAPCRNT